MNRFCCILSSILLAIVLIFPADSFSQRVGGPIVFYTFETVENNNIIRDVSGVEPIIDLEMTVLAIWFPAVFMSTDWKQKVS